MFTTMTDRPTDRQRSPLPDPGPNEPPRSDLPAHLASTLTTVASIRSQIQDIEAWGRLVAKRLDEGHRLLAAGNGGSAAQAQHLTAELVGRYRRDRRPLSAIALHAETSSLTAIANDYGQPKAFARLAEAHGRPDDIMVALSTSGDSANVVEAVRTARTLGMQTLALTGRQPNTLASACDGCITVDGPTSAHVQEGHLVVIHLLCEAIDSWFLDFST
jgi:D-sedoheptulose 7-phosphate isomerase